MKVNLIFSALIEDVWCNEKNVDPKNLIPHIKHVLDPCCFSISAAGIGNYILLIA